MIDEMPEVPTLTPTGCKGRSLQYTYPTLAVESRFLEYPVRGKKFSCQLASSQLIRADTTG